MTWRVANRSFLLGRSGLRILSFFSEWDATNNSSAATLKPSNGEDESNYAGNSIVNVNNNKNEAAGAASEAKAASDNNKEDLQLKWEAVMGAKFTIVVSVKNDLWAKRVHCPY